MSGEFRINKKSQDDFNKTLRDYSKYTNRTGPVIVNTKAYYISRRAVAETPMVEKEDIDRFTGFKGGSVAYKLINKKRRLAGKKGLYGKEMKKAVIALKASRMRGRAFVKSGWLWAVKKLAPLAEKRGQPDMNKKGDKRPKTVGQPKGFAVPASSNTNKARCLIVNTVTALWDKRNGALNVAVPALERAFEFERQSMLEYIKRKMQEGAKGLGIKTR